MRNIVLASKSPRRHELLEMAGIGHVVITADCDETIPEKDPEKLVISLSERKAKSVASLSEEAKKRNRFPKESLVVGADTIVYFNETVLGKPENKEEAFAMLKALNGKRHTVFTGVTLIDTRDGTCLSFCEHTDVFFYDVSDEELLNYVETGDPLDKAGSYGIQGRGAFLVRRIEGDYFTVVGFPLAHFLQALKSF